MAVDQTANGETIASTLADGSEELADAARPIRLGRHLLLARLGAGGMGVVFAAYDEKLDRKVAIKLLRSRGGEHAQLRLIREAQALARLSHPNVVQIYEIAEAGEQAYLVMEFVDGLTLGRWLAERPRSQAEILSVFLAAGRGLAAAHAAGLVHRDFKPDNVMIRSDGRVLVMDFGLAYADANERLEAASEGDTGNRLAEHLTATGAMMGTPAYMAPEQFLGVGTDAQTDQFGFCVALWEALHGSRPFLGRDLAAISLAVTEGRITRPERGEIPGWLREVIERGLTRDPTARWPSMHALLDALARDPTRPRRRALVAGGALTLVLAAVAGLYLLERRQQGEVMAACADEGQAIAVDWNDEIRAELEHDFLATEHDFAGPAWQATRGWLDTYAATWTELRTEVCVQARLHGARSEDALARSIDCFEEHRARMAGLIRAWAQVDRSTIIRAPPAAAGLPSLSACVDDRALARQLRPPDPLREQVVALRAQLEQAGAHEHLGKIDLALAQTEQVLLDIERLGWPPLLVEGLVQLGHFQEQAGKAELAVASLHRAALEGVECGHDLATLAAVSGLTVVVGVNQAKHEQGLSWAELGLRLVARLQLHDTLAEADMLNSLGSVQVAAGRIDEALEVDRRALQIREAVLGSDHVHVATSLDHVASLLADKGAYEEALRMFERVLEIRERTLGPDHFDLSTTLNGIGGVHMQLGQLDQALRCFERANQLIERTLGPEHVELAPSYNNMGVIHWLRGDYDDALLAFGRARMILEAALGPEHPRVAAALDNLGNVLLGQGAYEQALAMHQRTLAIREAVLGPEHIDIAASLNNLATVLAELGRDDEALPAFTRAQAIWTASLGPEHPHVATVTINIADVHTRRGEYDQALALQLRAREHLEAALGSDHVHIGYALLGSARARLGLGELDLARAELERALLIRERATVPLAELAEARFELAKLDWQQGQSSLALERARAARASYREAGQASAAKLAQVEAWLTERE